MTQLISGTHTANSLHVIASKNLPACEEVKAAIAYGAFDRLAFLEQCAAAEKYLTFYGRYDHTVPIDPRLLDWFLTKGATVATCKVVPDILHAKVIWWVGVGAYVGSANLTERAWVSNIEAGIYFEQDELVTSGMLEQIKDFFVTVDKKSSPLTKTIVDEMKRWEGTRRDIEAINERQKAKFDETRTLKRMASRTSGAESSVTPEQIAFKKKWTDALQVMLSIAKVVSLPENKPSWITSSASSGAQADQLVHAYYYKQVRGVNNSHPYEEFHAANRLKKKAVLDDVLKWWKKSDFDYSAEERMLNLWAPRLEELFAKHKLPTLSKEEFVEAMSHVHAVAEFGTRQRNLDIGLADERHDAETKVKLYCEKLWDHRSKGGKTPLETLNYVVWGSGPVEDRVWVAAMDDYWKIPGMKFSTLGEVVGWARGDVAPPRNERTIKGLRALGFDVSPV